VGRLSMLMSAVVIGSKFFMVGRAQSTWFPKASYSGLSAAKGRRKQEMGQEGVRSGQNDWDRVG
jgi:hypothetical protein